MVVSLMLSFDATKDMNCIRISNAIGHNVPPLHAVAKFGMNYFISSIRPLASGLLKIKILAKRKRELTTKFALERSDDCRWNCEKLL